MVQVGLIFGMVIAAMLIGFVLTFGLDFMANVMDINEDVQIEKTFERLEVAVERVYSMGGETAEAFRMTFPPSIGKICFFPLFDKRYGERGEYAYTQLMMDLGRVIDTREGKSQTQTVLASQRMQKLPGGGYNDKRYNVLVFYGSGVPKWYYVKYLSSMKKDVGSGHVEIVCVKPKEDVWLQRSYDDQGAWVDVELE